MYTAVFLWQERDTERRQTGYREDIRDISETVRTTACRVRVTYPYLLVFPRFLAIRFLIAAQVKLLLTNLAFAVIK